MILPIYVYGDRILRKEATEVKEVSDKLHLLIDNMWETMYNAHGVGLAGPQIGQSKRIFIIDTLQLKKDKEEPVVPLEGIKQVFINPIILNETGEEWSYEEGCLSIPDLRGEVLRKPDIEIEYRDENFVLHKRTFTGIDARVIQHEYDHLGGVLFTDKISPLKKALIKRKLDKMRKGNVQAEYPLKLKV